MIFDLNDTFIILDIIGLDRKFAGGITNPFSFDFANLTTILGGPLSEAQTNL